MSTAPEGAHHAQHDDTPIYLTIPEAAQRLNLSTRFIERLINTGDLPVHRFGRAVRIKRSTLDAVAETAEAEPLGGRNG